MDMLDKLSLNVPVIQAAMGGGISGPELVCAVSKAGGLGSLGHTSINDFRENIKIIKSELGKHSFSVNLLLPLATSAHIQACINEQVSIVSIFYGYKKNLVSTLKNSGSIVAYQVGSLAEAEIVVLEGVDMLIVQGCEAGGHLRGDMPLSQLLPTIRERFPELLVIAAGGIYNGATARAAIALGADGVAAGTRFLMSEESGAHRLYKGQLVEGKKTVVTSLFGFGWHAPHRVLQNKATERWIAPDGHGPKWIKPINKSAAMLSKYMPEKLQNAIYNAQNIKAPIYTPIVPTERTLKRSNVDCSALYAGECVAEINSIEPAATIVAEIGAAIN